MLKGGRDKVRRGRNGGGHSLRMLVVMALAFAFCLMCLAPIQIGSAQDEIWLTHVVDGDGSVGTYTDIAIDSNGFVHISYYDDTNEELKYATNSGGTWTTETVDDSGLYIGFYTSIALDSNDKVHISYIDWYGKDLKYATNSLGSWDVQTLDYSANSYTSIAIDSNDAVHISYHQEYNGDLNYVNNILGSWDYTVVDSEGDVGTFNAIAIDSSDSVHIGYSDNTNSDLKYATNAGGSWSNITVDSAGTVGVYVHMVIDTNDKLHMSYYDPNNGDLKYATDSSGFWEYQTLDSDGWFGYYNSIAVDGNDRPHILYTDWGNSKLKYATNAPGSWTKKTVVDDAVGQCNSIAIDSEDKLHICYNGPSSHLYYVTNALGQSHEVTADSSTSVGGETSIAIDRFGNAHVSHFAYSGSNLKYSTNVGGEWSSINVDSTGTVGHYSSIGIDSNGKVHISYFDSTNDDLKYATNAGGSWSTVTVDSYGEVGWETSLAIDPNDKVHIAYYNASADDLKYANNVMGYWSNYTLDSSGNTGWDPAIAIDSHGHIYISYHDYSNHDLKLATNVTGSWTYTLLQSSGDVGRYSSIAIDSEDHVHISYMENTDLDVWYATNATGPLTYTQIETESEVGDRGTSIALDSSDKAHITYFDDTNDDLKYATNRFGAWSIKVLDDEGNVGQYSSMAIDCNDMIHVSYRDLTNGHLKYFTNKLGAWNGYMVDGSRDSDYCTIDIDADGWLHCFYSARNTGVRYATNEGGTWEITPIADDWTELSAALDSNGKNHMAYWAQEDYALVYVTDATGSWTYETVEGHAGSIYRSVSLAVDHDDKVHLAYYNWSASAIVHADNAQGHWTFTTVDDTEYFADICITTDSNDKAHISYYDGDNNRLKYATNAGGSWSTVILDGDGDDVGRQSSIAIDSNDKVHISYFDSIGFNDGALKYTTNAGGSWAIEVLDSDGLAGWRTSIDIDDNDGIHIAYSEPFQDQLRYMNNKLGYWQKAIVDRDGGIYGQKAIVVDANERAYISYHRTSDNYFSVAFGPVTPPSPPQNFQATPGIGQVDISWSEPLFKNGSSIIEYRLYKGTSPGAISLLIALTGNSYADTSVVNGTTYYYSIRAINAAGEGDVSAEVSARTATAPTAPLSMMAISGLDNMVQLTWSPPSDDGGSTILSYRVYRGTTSGGEMYLTTVGGTSHIDQGLTNGETYYYQVSAVNLVGEGPLTDEASAMPYGSPSVPRNLQADGGDSYIQLTWDPPEDDGGLPIVNYSIYRGTSPGVLNSLTMIGNVTTYNDTTVINGQTYYYAISAGNLASRWGTLSLTGSATAGGVPSAPQNLQATPGDEQVELTWEPPSNDGGFSVTNYRIYRGTTSGGETFLIELGNVLMHTNTGLTNGQKYYYKVSAVNSGGEGALSNEASATPATTPTAPQNLQASPGNAQITLTWSAPSSDGGSDVVHYKVYRGTASGEETFLIELGNVLMHTDTGLTNGQTYYYKVTASNTVGEGPRSDEAYATPATVPTAPQNLEVQAGDESVDLLWSFPSSDGGSSVTNYRIYRGTSSGALSLLIQVGNVLLYSDGSVENGQTYYYQVSAVNSVGEGARSGEAYGTPLGPPSAPQELQSTPGDGYINLQWTAPIEDGGSPVIGYQIYRGTSSGGETTIATIGDLLYYNDTSVSNGITYYYMVSAENGVGQGPNSSEVSATPGSSATEPSAPQNLQASSGNAQITLTWSVPTNNGGATISGYFIYRGITSGGETFLVQIGATLTYTDTGLTNGQAYYYKVTAKNSVGEGPPSNEASAIPATVPTAPQGLEIEGGDGEVVLDWLAPSDKGGSTIINYRIFRGTSSGGESYLTSVGNVLTYTDASVTNGITYYYQVSAVNGVGEGPRTNEVYAIPATVPNQPRSLQAEPGDSFVLLSWIAPSSNGGDTITGYRVYRGLAPDALTTLVDLGQVLSYNDTSVTNGVKYYYEVTALNSKGESPRSVHVNATPESGIVYEVPSAPQNLWAEPGDSFVMLYWEAPLDNGGATITTYNIFRGISSGSLDALTTVGNVLEYQDASVTNGVTYYYHVTAVNSVGEGPTSDEVSMTPLMATLPSAPLDLKAVPGNAMTHLSWKAPANDGGATIALYNIYRGTSPDAKVLLVLVGNVLAYTDTGLDNGVMYYYQVSAVNSVGEGPLSNEASAMPATLPSEPLDVSFETGDSFVMLTWDPPSENGGSSVTGYTVYRGTSLSSLEVVAALENVTEYNDTSVTNGVTYYYQVSALNAIGEGLMSDPVSCTPMTFPSPPQDLEVESGDSYVLLIWNTPSDDGGGEITGYLIYRGESESSLYLLDTVGVVLQYNDTSAVNGVIYYYMVSALNSVGEGETSSIVNATPAAQDGAEEDSTMLILGMVIVVIIVAFIGMMFILRRGKEK